MVSYQKWTSLVFEQVPDEVVSNAGESAQIISISAGIWQDRKQELSTATVAEAREIAESEITVTR